MAQDNAFRLLGERRFAPLFWTQAFGAFNDNLFKQAMLLLLAFGAGKAAGLSGLGTASLTAIAGATFVAPSIVLSAYAGYLADTMDKAALARRLKLFEIVIMLCGAVALWTQNPYGLFAVLLLLGVQSALFGPVKYSLLPAHLQDDELVQGNAYVEGATFLAILLGTILGGLVIALDGGTHAMAGRGVCGCGAPVPPPPRAGVSPGGARPPRRSSFTSRRDHTAQWRARTTSVPPEAPASSRSYWSGAVVFSPNRLGLPAPWKSLEPVTTRSRSRAIASARSTCEASWSRWCASMPTRPASAMARTTSSSTMRPRDSAKGCAMTGTPPPARTNSTARTGSSA